VAHDTRYLERIKGRWRCVIAVPRPLHGTLGTKLKRSLHTGSLREAQARRWPVVAELKAQLAGKVQGQSTDSAEAWRAALAAGDGGPDDPTPHLLDDHLEALRGDPIVTEEDVDGSPIYIYHPERERRAVEFADRAYGRATPITAHLDAFLASRGELKADTAARHHHAIHELTGWLKRQGLPPTLQAVGRRTAITYSDQLPPGRPDPHRLSLYFRWMAKREHVPDDPFHDLSAPPRTRSVELERPFTDDEAATLLAGDATPEMHRLMRVAALSGARLSAIVGMKVEGDCLVFPPQKMQSKARRVPIHSSLDPAALRLPWPWRTGTAASQQFITYRRGVGVGEEAPGRKRSLVNFHSWRRWAIWKMEQAGQPENVIAWIVGHKRPGLTFGRYSAGPSMEQMRACIESIQLPTHTGASAP
jgi:hypothetical protein